MTGQALSGFCETGATVDITCTLTAGCTGKEAKTSNLMS